MVAFAGVGASLKNGAVTFNNASKWELDIKCDTKDVTPIGADGAWAVYIGTLNRWTAKITGWLDMADTAQTNLLTLVGQSVPLTLNVDGVPNGFTGSAILNDIAPNVDAQNPESCVYSFQGSGPITPPDLP
jgi:hypothetical protein